MADSNKGTASRKYRITQQHSLETFYIELRKKRDHLKSSETEYKRIDSSA